jgi:hypothetical protein
MIILKINTGFKLENNSIGTNIKRMSNKYPQPPTKNLTNFNYMVP